MTALPSAAEFTSSTITEAQFKAAITDLRSYLSGLLGSDGNIATALYVLGLGTAAELDAGTGAGEVLLLDEADKLPALDGSLLTNLPLPKAFVNFNGSTATVNGVALNVSSVTRNSIGDYTVNFTTNMSGTNYVVSVTPSASDNTTATLVQEYARAQNSFRFRTGRQSVGLYDPASVNLIVFEG